MLHDAFYFKVGSISLAPGWTGASENLPPWTVVTEFRATWTVVAANAPPWRVAKLGQLSEFSDSSRGRVRSNDCSRRAEFGNDCSRGQVFASAIPARSQRYIRFVVITDVIINDFYCFVNCWPTTTIIVRLPVDLENVSKAGIAKY